MLSQIFIAKAQINQCIKRSALMLAAVAARRFVQGCGPFVPNLSSWLSSREFELIYSISDKYFEPLINSIPRKFFLCLFIIVDGDNL